MSMVQEDEGTEEWNEITPNALADKDKVEFELPDDGLGAEEEEKIQAAKPIEYAVVDEDTDEVKTKPTEQVSEPEELEGIETKGAQKRIKQLIRQRKERDEELNKLKLEVSNLKSSVKERDGQLSTSLKTNIESSESQLTEGIEHAKIAYKQAVDQGDTDSMLKAQEAMSKNYAELNQVNQQRQAWDQYNNSLESNEAAQATAEQEQNNNASEYDPKAVEWATNNSWFGQDQMLTTAALTIDAALKSEGYDPKDEDFYKEIDTRLRGQYPARFQSQQPLPEAQVETPRLQDVTSSSAQVVAGASRTPKNAQGSGKNRVKLTKDDVRLAQKWGIPLDKYAAEKLKTEKADGEYTDVYNDI
jgi:hypothetical protein